MTFLNVMPETVCPQIEVSIDFDNDPTSVTTTWTDVTPYVTAYSRQPVRTNEFDQAGIASASLSLRNDDSRFTPDNSAGPYYGKLKKFRRVRVRAKWNGVTYDRFRGYLEDWPQSWDQRGKNQTVHLTLKDALLPLETFDLVGRSYTSALSGAAIAAVLDDAGITGYTLDTGASTIIASGTLTASSSALQRLQDIAASEMGVCFADGAGAVRFHDRHHRTLSSTVAAVIGDAFDGAEIPYDSPQPQFGDAWPVVVVTPSGGTPEISTNAAGVAAFFNRTLNFPTGGSYLVSSQSEAADAAAFLAARYGVPTTRIRSVTLLGARDTTLWPSILSLDTSSLVTFRRRLADATLIEIPGFVEGFGDVVQRGKSWLVTVPISPSNGQAYWLAGVAGRSEAGVSTVTAPY